MGEDPVPVNSNVKHPDPFLSRFQRIKIKKGKKMGIREKTMNT